jgi:hypothetical protein
VLLSASFYCLFLGRRCYNRRCFLHRHGCRFGYYFRGRRGHCLDFRLYYGRGSRLGFYFWGCRHRFGSDWHGLFARRGLGLNRILLLDLFLHLSFSPTPIVFGTTGLVAALEVELVRPLPNQLF